MADITNIEANYNGGKVFTFSNGAASQTFDLSVPDEKTVVLVRNDDTNDAMVTLEAGDFFQEGYGDIESPDISQNEYCIFEFDSAVVKDTAGEVTVTVLDPDGSAFTGTEADVKIAVLEL